MCDGVEERAPADLVDGPYVGWVMVAELETSSGGILVHVEYRDDAAAARRRAYPGSTPGEIQAHGTLTFPTLAAYVSFRDFWMDADGEVEEL